MKEQIEKLLADTLDQAIEYQTKIAGQNTPLEQKRLEENYMFIMGKTRAYRVTLNLFETEAN